MLGRGDLVVQPSPLAMLGRVTLFISERRKHSYDPMGHAIARYTKQAGHSLCCPRHAGAVFQHLVSRRRHAVHCTSSLARRTRLRIRFGTNNVVGFLGDVLFSRMVHATWGSNHR